MFLKERLQGTATIGLKDFLYKHRKNSDDQHVEEVGSFQLRKKSSNKPQGFVDVSFRISPETDERNSYEGKLCIFCHGVEGVFGILYAHHGLAQVHSNLFRVPPTPKAFDYNVK